MGKGAGHHKSWRWLLGGLFFFRSQPLTRPLGQPCVRRTGREMEAAEQEKKKKNVARVLFLVSAVFLVAVFSAGWPLAKKSRTE